MLILPSDPSSSPSVGMTKKNSFKSLLVGKIRRERNQIVYGMVLLPGLDGMPCSFLISPSKARGPEREKRKKVSQFQFQFQSQSQFWCQVRVTLLRHVPPIPPLSYQPSRRSPIHTVHIYRFNGGERKEKIPLKIYMCSTKGEERGHVPHPLSPIRSGIKFSRLRFFFFKRWENQLREDSWLAGNFLKDCLCCCGGRRETLAWSGGLWGGERTWV